MDREEAIFALGQGVPVVFYLTAVNERYGGDYHRIYEFAGRSKSKSLVTTEDRRFPEYNADGSIAINTSPPRELENGCTIYDHFFITPGYICDDRHPSRSQQYTTEDDVRRAAKQNRSLGGGRNSVTAQFLDWMRAAQTGEQAVWGLHQSIYYYGAVAGPWGEKLAEIQRHYAGLVSLLKTIRVEEQEKILVKEK